MAIKTVGIQPGALAGAAEGLVSYQMEFVSLDTQPQFVLVLPYNPESYRIRVNPRWSERNGSGAEFDASDWEGNSPRTLSYQHLLTAQNVEGPSGGDVESVIQQFNEWSTRPTVATQRPTRIRVTAGDGLHFVGVIENVEFSRVRTTPAGLALTAEFDMTLREVDRAF